MQDAQAQRRAFMGESRNRIVQVRRFGGPEGLEVVDTTLIALVSVCSQSPGLMRSGL
jgi:hypothetical protein